MVRLTDRPDMTLDVHRGRKITAKKTTTFLFGALNKMCFLLPKQSLKSTSILLIDLDFIDHLEEDRSRYLGLFWKEKA